jgi:hypothetical protein
VVQQHLERGGKVGGAELVDSSENPGGFGQRENGYPGAFLDEAVGRFGLPEIVSRNEPNQNISVNRAHDASGYAAGSPVSCHRLSVVPAPVWGTAPMDVLRRKPSRTPHDDVFAVLMPFQDRAGAYAELLTDTDGDGNLPLRRDLRVSDCRMFNITTVMQRRRRLSNGRPARLQ